MSEKTNATGQAAEAVESEGIMQNIQDMIGDLLKNTIDKMHKEDIGDKLGNTLAHQSDSAVPSTQLGLDEIKNFVNVMQKFIDSVNVMIVQMETGNMGTGGIDNAFIEGYMATADNVLEIAAFSMKDSLTGLSNRYSFDHRLILEWNRAVRDKSALGFVIFGISGTGESSDGKSHDIMLKTVAKTLENTIKRSTDFIARWGDDEFAILLPITDSIGALVVAERLRTEIETKVSGILDNSGKTSVSIGVCVHTPEPNEQLADYINKAYDAYIKAKSAAGNSIVVV